MAEIESYAFLSDEKDYNQTFDYFTRGRVEQQKVWVVNEFVPKLQNLENCDGTWRVLAVGSNNGAFDFILIDEFVKIIEKVKGKISWTVVEPNYTAIEGFKEKVKQRQTFLKNVEFEWINKTFDEFLTSFYCYSESKKFNLVHFVHCLYYMPEKIVIDTTMEKLLLPNGQVLVVVGTENDVWERLFKEYKAKVHTLSTELHYLTNKSITEYLDESEKWRHTTFTGKLDLEITEIFEKNHPGGTALLQFFLHTKEDPRKLFDPKLIAEIIEFLRNISWMEKTENNEKSYVCDDEGIIIISHH